MTDTLCPPLIDRVTRIERKVLNACAPSVTEPKPDGQYVLDRSIKVTDVQIGLLRQFLVPKGFTFDRASIPRLLRVLVDKDELGLLAPLVHDFLYRGFPGGIFEGRPYRRIDVDRFFYDLMRATGVGYLRARAAYLAVRAFGGLRAWKGVTA